MLRPLALALLATPAPAEIVVPARTLAPQTLIAPEDLVLSDAEVPGAISDPAQAIGLETRVALYPGRPIRPQDLGLPAVVERNAIVALVYDRGGLLITAEGRALDRAGPGEVIRVMNTASRTTVSARVGTDGAAYVSE
ncbi:flagellar basal body P-ring formation chaperone FlgA [Rubellimicrobium aerolatum]|uniref:Flagella basal body P-ring formation protein FlgA n=1 Tax=Rubellimicrobium aerolatum TaxID=490979 RepID=A0ABW0SA31_9RHOB|nr:flagellar basal body P-ring formation chaperone FlgA [Rubellimicrobium aerolatum]MBP1805071.1 flagella basal body P-ring formation protein FlgA [Rubellimicrobium aerolatum]